MSAAASKWDHPTYKAQSFKELWDSSLKCHVQVAQVLACVDESDWTAGAITLHGGLYFAEVDGLRGAFPFDTLEEALAHFSGDLLPGGDC